MVMLFAYLLTYGVIFRQAPLLLVASEEHWVLCGFLYLAPASSAVVRDYRADEIHE